jgi:hypothetical protein
MKNGMLTSQIIDVCIFLAAQFMYMTTTNKNWVTEVSLRFGSDTAHPQQFCYIGIQPVTFLTDVTTDDWTIILFR